MASGTFQTFLAAASDQIFVVPAGIYSPKELPITACSLAKSCIGGWYHQYLVGGRQSCPHRNHRIPVKSVNRITRRISKITKINRREIRQIRPRGSLRWATRWGLRRVAWHDSGAYRVMLDDEHRRHRQETCKIFLWFLFIILIVPSLNILAPWKKKGRLHYSINAFTNAITWGKQWCQLCLATVPHYAFIVWQHMTTIVSGTIGIHRIWCKRPHDGWLLPHPMKSCKLLPR